MDVMLLLKAAVMGVVEGLTEFLPVSSTGHLILAGSVLGLKGETTKLFEVVIQSGAILAIVSLYIQRLWRTVTGLASDPQAQKFAINVILGFIPAAVMGVLFIKTIKAVLFNPFVVAAGFIVGGLIMLWVEARQKRQGEALQVASVDEIGWKQALGVGLLQCVAMVPGVSRSGATIIGGMVLGLNRRTATEFSFFLALPVLVGAATLDLLKHGHLLTANDVPFFAVGLLFSFVSAWVCVRWLVRYVAQHNFVGFAWYRIAFGLFILLTGSMGLIQWAD